MMGSEPANRSISIPSSIKYEIAVRAGSARVRTIPPAPAPDHITPHSRSPRSSNYTTLLRLGLRLTRPSERSAQGRNSPFRFLIHYSRYSQAPLCCCFSNTQILRSSHPCLRGASCLALGSKPIVVRIVHPSASGSQVPPNVKTGQLTRSGTTASSLLVTHTHTHDFDDTLVFFYIHPLLCVVIVMFKLLGTASGTLSH
jgi:hypothetical protein